MTIIYITVGILTTLALFLFVDRQNKKKLLYKLRISWGKRSKDQIEINLAKNLATVLRAQLSKKSFFIDDKTWQDLDMDECFKLINRTITPIGGQFLYFLLRTPVFEKEKLIKREELIAHFSRERSAREKAQIILSKLADKNAGYLIDLLWHTLPSKPKLSIFFPITSLFSCLCLLLVIMQIWHWWILILVFTFNLVLRHISKRKIDDFIVSFKYLGHLINIGHKICRLKSKELEHFQKELQQNLQKTKKLKSKILSLQLQDSFGFSDYINIFFLLDITAFYSALTEIQKHRSALKIIFTIIGQIDSFISIASFREEYSDFCKPFFSENIKEFRVENIYHPLLKNPIKNVFDFKNPNVLVTGSNMSGKTTFLKTIGLNVILAQTINMTMASKYIAPFLKVLSSISRSDDLLSGKSYYYAEVESILNIINQSNFQTPVLILIDEIFRGTNSVERQAASIEVFDYLSNKGNFILGATHDMDLTEILVKNYKNYHFSERLDKAGLDFDYKIKPGASTTRNAIALLDFVGYPKTIVDRVNKRIKSNKTH